MLADSKVVDAPPHGVSIERTVEMAKDFELLVLFTSTPGFHVDVKMAEMMATSRSQLERCQTPGYVNWDICHGRIAKRKTR